MPIILPNTTNRKPLPCCQYDSGFTLIEVLVTIVVLSIGLLGLAELQISGLRANMSSEARSKATLLASDIVERMRANPLGVAAGAYHGIAASKTICAGVRPVPFCSSTSGNNGIVPSCTTGATMAAVDAWVWGCGMAPPGVQQGGVANQLPNGMASVTCNDNDPDDAFPCTPGSQNTITISWNELSPTDGAFTPQTISLTIVP